MMLRFMVFEPLPKVVEPNRKLAQFISIQIARDVGRGIIGAKPGEMAAQPQIAPPVQVELGVVQRLARKELQSITARGHGDREIVGGLKCLEVKIHLDTLAGA
jgi:hypothetical protein